MAQLLIIKTEKEGLQYIGDVVGVFRDEHIFSSDELEIFNVQTIKGSKTDVKAKLQQLAPVIANAYLHSDGKYYFEESDPYLSMIEVLKIGIRWYEVKNDFKFNVNVNSLTPEEKQTLETVDIKDLLTDDSIQKMIKDYTLIPGNDVEIKDLRNKIPA